MTIRNYLNALKTVERLDEAQNYEDMFKQYLTLLQLVGEHDTDMTDPARQQFIEKIVNQRKITIHKAIQFAKAKLKKNDRIVWFLKLVRLLLVNDILKANKDTPELYNKIKPYFFSNLNSFDKPNIVGNWIDNSLRTDTYIEHFGRQLEHFYSLPIPEIQNIVLLNQDPESLIESFQELENKWKTSRTETVQHPEDAEIIMKFPDGKMWVNLNKPYCKEEGEAMGHCGNSAAYVSGDTVLSLREPMKIGKETLWRPLLTFILHDNGYLGEMKGRANEKPAARYHPYIIALLKTDLIDGISGGGYAPGHNFSLMDLTPEQRDELFAEKPELATASFYYEKYGMTEETIAKTIQELKAADIWSQTGIFAYKNKVCILEKYDSVTDMVDRRSVNARYSRNSVDVTQMLSYINGNGILDVYEIGSSIESLEYILNNIHRKNPKVFEALKKYLETTHPDEYAEYENFDAGDAAEMIKEHDDEMWGYACSADTAGYESGSYRAIYESFSDMISSFNVEQIGLTQFTDRLEVDSPIYVVEKPEDFYKRTLPHLDSDNFYDNGSYISSEDWTDQLSMREPRDEYDIDGAAEYFENEIHSLIKPFFPKKDEEKAA